MSSTEVHFFTECLGSMETAVDELHSCTPILLSDVIARAQSYLWRLRGRAVYLKTSHITRRRRNIHAMFIHFSASLLKHSSVARRRSSCQQIEITEADLGGKRRAEKKRLHCRQCTRGCWCTHNKGCSGEVSTTQPHSLKKMLISLCCSFTMCRMWISVFNLLKIWQVQISRQLYSVWHQLPEGISRTRYLLSVVVYPWSNSLWLTSRIFSVEKKTAFQELLKGDSVLQSCANASILPNQTMAVIDHLRCHAMAVLFGDNGRFPSNHAI